MADAGGLHKRALTSVADHDGVLDEILARLPVKSLMRFRCVCKPWRALISQSHFVTKHFTYASQGITDTTSRLLFSTNPVESIDHEALKDLNDADSHLVIRRLKFPEVIVIWNPCTGESNVLPKPTDHCIPQFCGFGYDSANDDYKVVRGFGYRVGDSGGSLVQVFSVKSGAWKTHGGLNYFNLAGRGCLLNGALHWLETIFTDYRPTGSRIISFDLGEEEFREMLPLPYHACFSYIFTLGDCLSVYILGFLHNETTGFRIWMMKEYGVKESWSELICSESLPEEYELSLLTPLCILENGEVLMVKIDNYQSLVLYSPKEQIFRVVIRTQNKWKLDAAIYRETLVSPVTSRAADI